jgi:hypothetical protein
LFRKIPLTAPAQDGSETFTCRVWVRQAICQLVAAKVINCPDVMALEEEIEYYGKNNNLLTLIGGGFKVYESFRSA